MTAQKPVDVNDFLSRRSFVELKARDRALSLLDNNTGTELLGPFDRMESPWLPMQGIVPQADDGCVVILGKIESRSTVVIALEGRYQGGSIGEVSGTKIACALELALKDTEDGTPTSAVLLLETGGVRLQEANLGLMVIAEIHSAIIALRHHVPVVAVIAGMTGCFGGMAISAALCSHLIMTRAARLGLNGPEVIEQEAGVEEFDASDRQLVWSILGGEQRYQMGFADFLVDDDVKNVIASVGQILNNTLPTKYRAGEIDLYRRRITAIDADIPFDGPSVTASWGAAS